MGKLRILTAGESHGQGLMGILEGMPAGMKIDQEKINHQLKRRQKGYGRGNRMQIESDQAVILSGLRFGTTLGSPITVYIQNKDWTNWQKRMHVWKGKEKSPLRVPRPGHADLAGSLKYDHHDLRNTLERASARETAMRVAIGSIIRQFLEYFNIWIGSHVVQIHQIHAHQTFRNLCESLTKETPQQIQKICQQAEASQLHCGDKEAEKSMKRTIQQSQKKGDSVGGLFEVVALNVPIGLGSYAFWDRRLDAQIAAYMMSIPAIKAVEIGLGIECGSRYGSEVHDPIIPGSGKIPGRSSNRAGGTEGGISNGQPIIVQATMKPIPTLKKPLPSLNLDTGEPIMAHKERSDVCAVPSASIVGEAMLAIALGNAFLDKYGGDSMKQIRRQYDVDPITHQE